MLIISFLNLTNGFSFFEKLCWEEQKKKMFIPRSFENDRIANQIVTEQNVPGILPSKSAPRNKRRV